MRRGRDPHWMTARYPGVCAKTGVAIKAGDRVFYYPSERKMLVGEAAEQASRDFAAAVQDEETYASY